MTKKENKEVEVKEMKLNIYQKLMNIQAELRAKKNRRNDYGGFNYRSAEDILEAVKPICQKYGVLLTLNDEVEYSDSWHYVKATAKVINVDDPFCTLEHISCQAYARESEVKKGMDAMQITGSASSYARKYALNGLFCIDDAKDADDPEYYTDKDASQEPVKKGKSKTQSRGELLERLVKAKRYFIDKNVDIRDVNAIEWLKQESKTKSVDESILTDIELSNLINVYGKLAQIVESGKELPFKTDSDQLNKNEVKEPTLDELMDSVETLVGEE